MIGNDKSQSLRIRGGSQIGRFKNFPAIFSRKNEEDAIFGRGGLMP